ncbi:MAG: HAD family hydrolase [Actinomycetes bacterium]
MALTTLALDGDDTLWHSETHFAVTTERVLDLVRPWVDGAEATAHLLEVERRNLETFGYGVKAFILSVIETVVEVTRGEVPADRIHEIVGWAKELLAHPVELMDGVVETLDQLDGQYRLLLITKGDLLHQESKVARSGLADRFDAVEIVGDKDPATYRRILERHRIAPDEFVMAGNSLRSDVAPVVALGGWGVHVPFHLTWALEAHDGSGLDHRTAVADGFAALPDALATLAARAGRTA